MVTFPLVLGAVVLVSAGASLVLAPFDPRVVVTGAVGGVLILAEAVRRARSRVEGLSGQEGEVLVGGWGGGRVRVGAGDWRARWRGNLRAGEPVRVVAVLGQSLEVEAVVS